MIALLNASVVTTDGTYVVESIEEWEAFALVTGGSPEVRSYIGHPATAQIMETLLGTPVPVSRDLYSQQVGDTALVFKLNGRPEPGRELSREELEKIGYSFKVMYRTA